MQFSCTQNNELILTLLTLFIYMFHTQASDEINVPPAYSNCSCQWTDWMNSDDVADGKDQETLRALREHGYQFCEKPVDIQCYNIAASTLITQEPLGVTCNVELGLNCQFFCDDYKVRVACCYCPPPAIGPSFQIESQNNRRCLSVVDTPAISAAPSLTLSTPCDGGDPSQSWNWVSTKQLKNKHKKQCLSTNQTSTGAVLITTNCDVTDAKQRWDYDKSTMSLSASSGYLSAVDGRYTTSASNSHWLAKVDIGSTDLNTMQGWQCKNPPTDPEHGTVSCTFGSYQGSECHFSCDYGYKQPANAEYPTVCMKNGQYNASAPTCQQILCSPPITMQEHGSVVCSSANRLDSSCDFSCDVGYKLTSKNTQSICLDTGNWENYPPPRCERITCLPDLTSDVVANGDINCTDDNFYNSRCQYSCNQGYELIGPQVRSCMESGSWNNEMPLCQKIQCPQLPVLPHGSTTCSNSHYFMSSCRYACDLGYTMVGAGSTTCNSDGMWGSEAPDCQRKTCNELSSPDHGSFSCSDSSYFSSTCSFQCDKGYQIKGESSLTCTAEGWNHGSPECTRIVCAPHLQSPVNGEVHCSDGDFYNSGCTFTCQSGYEVKGSKVVVCERNGWNDTTSTCQKKRCLPALTNPRNGHVICSSSNEYGSFCVYNCNQGYTTSQQSSFPQVCQESGEWGGQPQTCRRIQCRRITSLRRGSVTCTDLNNYKSNCTFKCNDGFNLYGATEAVCGVTGWDAQTPSCQRILCNPPLVQPADGQLKCSSRGKLTCTFSCNKGFQLVGNNKTQCQSDESWSNPEVPVCERIRCNEGVRTPSHGSVKCTNRDMYESECNYTCNRGYTRVGEQLTHCTESGEWDINAPTCQRISCPALSSLSHGDETVCSDGFYYGSSCTFSCNPGYVLIGLQTTQCNLNSTWSTRLPYCERITCSGFSNPSNGRMKCSDYNNFGSVCTFHCEEGFNLVGASQTRCNVDGWSVTKAPTCKKITCPVDANVVAHGTESCGRSNEYQSRCKYECNEGYELIGSSSRLCNHEGQWTNSKPLCQRIMCPALSQISNGDTVCPTRNKYEYDTECVFLCDEGYQRIGTSKMHCQNDKSWNPPDLPICEIIPTTTKTSTTPNVTTTTTISTTTTIMTPDTTVVPVTTPTTPVKPPTNSIVKPPTDPPPLPPKKPTILPEPVTPQDNTGGEISTTTQNNEPVEPAAAGIPVIPIAVSIVVVVLIIVCVTLFIVWKRRNQKSQFSKGIPMQEHRYDEGQLQKLIPNGSTNRRFPTIPLDRLESEFARKHADDDKLFREEFSSLPEGHGTRENGGKIINKEKNRYTNIIPYDHSRVVLPKANNSDSDYINASFIDGYKHKGKFIAAQGPKDSTINDFWRMVWDQNVTTIIMATNLVEGKETKCSLYWPQSGSEVYGDLNVVFTGENHLVDYTIRKFTIQQVCGDATLSMRRNLMHYHFTSWPDFGVPKTPSGMLKFLRKIKHGSPTGYGAIVVHCSAGVGRTGTFVCIDAMVDMMLRENKIDVHGFVSQMRSQRPEMVQTEQQYIFIYQALLEHHLYGDTEVEATEMSSHIDELNQRMPGNVTGMEHEFKKLTTIRIQKEQMRAGNHPANMRKNRVLLILPYDWNRVILPIKRGVENTDYINASYIDGYRQKDAYIATQGPLPHTVEDFWRLIWESQSASIVMLTELVERGQAKCEQYWPDTGAMIYGDLNVENITETELENYSTRDFVITSAIDPSERKQMVRQFHYHGWPETGPPVSGFSMIALVEQVQKQQQTSGNHPITIHCSAGAGRTGAFCALSTALEQVKAEGVLDMFQIVKCLRMQRPHMVQNMEQYEFCYRAVQEYIDSMSEYYNFK